MQFNEVIQAFLEEKRIEEEKTEPQPWCIEITKDLSRSKEYNELGDLIIKLFQLRAKM
jgi:hypothetical protein